MGLNFDDPLRINKMTGVQSGKFFEKAMLSECSPEVDENGGHIDYLSYKASVQSVIDHQPYGGDRVELMKHENAQMKQLRIEIIGKLPSVDYALKFYTAIGTVLDFKHGVDGIYILGPYQVTIDLTLNPDKESPKADVVICGDDEKNGLTDEIISQASEEIVEIFEKKIKQQNNPNNSWRAE